MLTLRDYVSEWVYVMSRHASCHWLMNASNENECCKIRTDNSHSPPLSYTSFSCLNMWADQIRCYLNVQSSMTGSMKCLHPWMLHQTRVNQTKFVQFSIRLRASYCAFLSMLTILLNFSLVAMSSGVSPSWRQKSMRWEPARGVQGLLGTYLRSTYIVANVDVGVLLQQQRHQTLTLPLADVVKCGIPLLPSQHMISVNTKLMR